MFQCKDCKFKGNKDDIEVEPILALLEQEINPQDREEEQALIDRAHQITKGLIRAFEDAEKSYPYQAYCKLMNVVKVAGDSPAQQFNCDKFESIN